MPSPFVRPWSCLFAATMLTWGSQALAQDACEPYTAEAFTADLEALNPLFEAVDIEGAGSALTTIHDKLECLSVVASREDFARYARAEATIGFLSQDEDRSLRWGRAAKFADPDGAWPVIIPEGHPVTTLPDDVGPPLWGSPDGKQFNGGRGDSIFANGVFIASPRLASEVPFLVQRFDRRERFVAAYWQDGAAFPDDVLEDGDAELEAPDWVAASANEAPGLGESESFSMAIDTGDEPGDGDPEEEPEVVVPQEPVDDRPVEERAREAFERAIGIADLNPERGRNKIVDFMDEFGDSGIPEVADAQRWLDRHPVAEEPEAPGVGPGVPDVVTTPEVVTPERPPRERRVREPRERGNRGSPGLRTISYIAGGTALAMYGGALGTRAAYNSTPSDGLYYATNGMTAGAAGVGTVAAGLFVTSFLVGGGGEQ